MRPIFWVLIAIGSLFVSGAIAEEKRTEKSEKENIHHKKTDQKHDKDRKVERHKKIKKHHDSDDRPPIEHMIKMMKKHHGSDGDLQIEIEREIRKGSPRHRKMRSSKQRKRKDHFPFELPIKDLSDEQRQKLQLIRMRIERSRIEKMAQIKMKEIDIRIALLADEIPRDKIQGLIREIGNLKIEMEIEKVNAMFTAFDLLNDDQKKKIRKHMTHKLSTD